MQPAARLEKVSRASTQVGTLLTCGLLLDAEGWREATLSDISSGSFDDAYRGLGLTHAAFWIQRNPDVAVAMWEGADIDTFFERFDESSHPVIAKWRGLLRMFSGPQEAENFWDASHHRLLAWSTGEQGAESEVVIYREPRQVDAYRRLAEDFAQDASLMGILDRLRRRQGFTRIETWHQRTKGDDILLTLVEAHDLNASMAQLMAEDNELDRRTMAVVRSTLLHSESPPPAAELLARWHA